MRVGFIGIGLMGEATVRRLLDRGHAVTVWNLEPERLATVVPHGAVAADTPADVAAESDIVLTCVLHTEAVRSVVLGPQGIARAPRRASGGLLVDLSTADPEATRTMAAMLRAAAGMGWVDAPVSGGPDAARTGTLAVMAGGDEADFDAALPLLRDLAANVTRMGPVGAGQTTKLINQAIVGTGFVVMAEALALAEAAGIDAAAMPACLAGGFADGALLRRLWPHMQQRRFDTPIGYARQLLKDMQAVQARAEALGQHLPVVAAATSRHAEFVAQGNDMADSAAILRLYRPDP